MASKLWLLILFNVVFVANWQSVNGGRGRGSSHGRGTSHHSTHSSNHHGGSGSSNGGFFSWFRSGNRNTLNTANQTPKKVGSLASSPPSQHRSRGISSQSHNGFAAYSNNYPSNFHHSEHTPVAHPYQNYFQPQSRGTHQLEIKHV